jgi:hypothetical protein
MEIERLSPCSQEPARLSHSPHVFWNGASTSTRGRTESDAYNNSCWMCIRYCCNVFTEPLLSNDGREDTQQLHRQQSYLKSLLLFLAYFPYFDRIKGLWDNLAVCAVYLHVIFVRSHMRSPSCLLGFSFLFLCGPCRINGKVCHQFFPEVLVFKIGKVCQKNFLCSFPKPYIRDSIMIVVSIYFIRNFVEILTMNIIFQI